MFKSGIVVVFIGISKLCYNHILKYFNLKIFKIYEFISSHKNLSQFEINFSALLATKKHTPLMQFKLLRYQG